MIIKRPNKKNNIFNKYDIDVQSMSPEKLFKPTVLNFEDKEELKVSLYHFYKAESKITERCFRKEEDGTYTFHDDEFYKLCGNEYYQWVGISPRNRKFIR